MPRYKVTRRPSARPDTVLKPSLWRMTLIYAILFVVAIGIGLLIRALITRENLVVSWLQENWPVTLVALFGGSALLSLAERSRWSLRLVGGDRLEGPSGFGERVTLHLAEIDWKRTRRSLSSRMKIGNGIYDNERNRILVSPWFFDPAKFREMMAMLGYPLE